MYLKNCWYVAAWDHEILVDTLLQRTIIGESLVMYRTAAGQVVAMDNRCCHRHAPLHLGRREGDCVRCMYHGLKYDATGKCVDIPGQEMIPAKLMQRVYPTVQRKRWVWIWMGKPELADESLIQDMFSLTSPEWRWIPSYLHYNCNYLNICDNLLDFSHLSYVHEKTFGGSPNIAEAKPEVKRIERGVAVSRDVKNTVPAPYHQRLGQFSGKVNRWFSYDFVVPGILRLDGGVVSVDNAEGDHTGALRFHSCQAVTPETDQSTHYFYMQAHNFRLDDATITESIHQSQRAAFLEDKTILEAQQQMINQSPDVAMLPIAADLGLSQYRRILQALIEAEAVPPSPSMALVE